MWRHNGRERVRPDKRLNNKRLRHIQFLQGDNSWKCASDVKKRETKQRQEHELRRREDSSTHGTCSAVTFSNVFISWDDCQSWESGTRHERSRPSLTPNVSHSNSQAARGQDPLLGSVDSSVVRASDSWSKGPGFESRQERRENFLLQGQLSVLTLYFGIRSTPPVTAVARKRSRSFCQMCWWQNTVTGTLPRWLWMKQHRKLVHGCTVYTEHVSKWQQFHVAPAMQPPNSVVSTTMSVLALL